MAITTYDTLQDAIGTQLQRSEFSSSGTRAADTEACIALAEGELNDLFETREMETRSTASISTQYAVLPDDWGGLRSLKIDGYPPLLYLTPDVGDKKYTDCTGRPLYYSIIGEQLKFWPEPDTTYTAEALHFLKVPALSDSATSNWLLTRRPDIYLNGALKYLQGYYLFDETGRAILHHQAMMLGVDQMESADKRRKWGSALTVQPDVMIV
jgi:hypothetical protein